MSALLFDQMEMTSNQGLEKHVCKRGTHKGRFMSISKSISQSLSGHAIGENAPRACTVTPGGGERHASISVLESRRAGRCIGVHFYWQCTES